VRGLDETRFDGVVKAEVADVQEKRASWELVFPEGAKGVAERS
jgi:hypothetical protein